MLQTQTARLSQQQQGLVHADFLADELAYLNMRAGLIAQYRGQWVAVKDGTVITAGPDLMAVMETAATAGGHPYIALVGAEDAVVFRGRRAVFGYDAVTPRTQAPRFRAEHQHAG